MTSSFLNSLRLGRLLVCVGALTAAGAALGQTYPSKPVQLIVPFAAGGPLDIGARVIAKELQASLKQPFLVVNQTGASGNIGGAAVARSAPDGYTILLTADTSMAANPALYGPRMGFSVERDLRPVGTMMAAGMMLVVHPSLRVQTVAEFVARGKDKGVTYASAGNGVPAHLLMEQMAQLTGIKATHIPYKGTAPAINDLIGGQVESGFLVTPGVIQHVKTGRVTPLATSGAVRSELAPNVPTMAELGLPGLTMELSYVAMVPQATAVEIVNLLNDHLRRATQSEAFRTFMRENDLRAIPDTPADTGRRLAAATERFSALIKARNIRVD